MKKLRIIVGAILPPALGSFFVCAYLLIADRSIAGITMFPLALVFGYVIMIIPSIAYSIVMEGIVREWKEKKVLYYGAAGLLGGASSMVLHFRGIEFDDIFTTFLIVGILVGMSTAFALNRLEVSDLTETNESEPAGIVNDGAAPHRD